MRSPWSVLVACSLTLLGPVAFAAAPPGAATAPPTKAAPAAPKPAPAGGDKAAAPAATAAPPAAPTAARPPAAQVVAQMQKVYEHTAAIKARFAQTLTGPTGKRQASGGVVLKKPGKMRWDYEKPEKKLFVADGTTLWVYEPEDEQAFKQSLSSSQLPTQVSFLFGRGKLLDEFDVSYLDSAKAGDLGDPGDLVLKLVPKVASAQYRYLVFVVNPTTYLVKETVLYDQQDGTNHITFSGLDANPKNGVDDSRFVFTPPAGTKIISPGR